MNYKSVTKKVIVDITAFMVIFVIVVIIIEIMNFLTLFDYPGSLRI